MMTWAEFNKNVNSGFLGLEKMIPKELAAALQRAARLVQRTSQEKYLSGPRPEKLGVVSGRLRRSIATRVDVSGSRVTALVGTNVVYGRIHELGFRGRVLMSQRLRGHSMVRAGGRNMRMRARPFLAPAIADHAEETKQMVAKSLKEYVVRKILGK